MIMSGPGREKRKNLQKTSKKKEDYFQRPRRREQLQTPCLNKSIVDEGRRMDTDCRGVDKSPPPSSTKSPTLLMKQSLLSTGDSPDETKSPLHGDSPDGTRMNEISGRRFSIMRTVDGGELRIVDK